MIGQKKVIEKLNKFNIDTFPRSTLILGEKGMGKHTLVSFIRDTIIKLPLIDITDNLSSELIEQIYRNPNPSIYIIDLSLMTEKEQNIILKFIEEPLNNSFIIILAENKNMLLDTVVNRCVIFELEAYSKDELKTFITNETLDKNLILEIIKAPGVLLNTNLNSLNDILDVCNKITTKLNQANYANVLSIGNKINFKDFYDKFDLNIFMNSLCYSLFTNFLTTNSNVILNMYNLTREQRKLIALDKRLNKELFFNNFITKLWKVSRG